MFTFRYAADIEAKQILKENETNRRTEQERKQEESQRKLIRENTIISLNQDISYVKDCILSIDETIIEANSDIEKALKSSMLKRGYSAVTHLT